MRPWRPELAILREYHHAHLVIYYQRWLTVYAIDLMIMNRSLHHWSRSPPVAVPAARAQPDLGDAIQLVLAVKREFAGVPGKYEEFLAVLQEHRRSVMTIAFIS